MWEQGSFPAPREVELFAEIQRFQRAQRPTGGPSAGKRGNYFLLAHKNGILIGPQPPPAHPLALWLIPQGAAAQTCWKFCQEAFSGSTETAASQPLGILQGRRKEYFYLGESQRQAGFSQVSPMAQFGFKCCQLGAESFPSWHVLSRIQISTGNWAPRALLAALIPHLCSVRAIRGGEEAWECPGQCWIFQDFAACSRPSYALVSCFLQLT